MTSPQYSIMLIEPQPVVRKGLATLVHQTRELQLVAESADPAQMPELIRLHQPDVVVFGMNDSPENLELLTSSGKENPGTQIIAFGSHTDQACPERALNAGACCCIDRNSELDILSEALNWACTQGTRNDHLGNSADSTFDVLSPREFEVFRMLAEGYSVKEIAAELHISPNTVGIHQTRVFKKLGRANVAQLARLAIQHGVIAA